jgi:carbonic anhydrase/acetyltransferase-like protein (isoleucine patch superfamily)
MSVWFGAVLRGDNEWIEARTCRTIDHRPRLPSTIGKNCTVGHNVILHGCTLEDGALVGMGSIVMNGADPPRQHCRRGIGHHRGQGVSRAFSIIGSPARVIRTLVRAG